MVTPGSERRTGQQGNASRQDPVGPHGDDAKQRGSRVEGSRTQGAQPLDAADRAQGGRGNDVRRGRTAAAQGADSAPLGPPAEILSDHIGPSDPDRRGPKV